MYLRRKRGDWTCAYCNARNFRDRKKCFRCFTMKPSAPPVALPPLPSSPMYKTKEKGDDRMPRFSSSGFVYSKSFFVGIAVAASVALSVSSFSVRRWLRNRFLGRRSFSSSILWSLLFLPSENPNTALSIATRYVEHVVVLYLLVKHLRCLASKCFGFNLFRTVKFFVSPFPTSFSTLVSRHPGSSSSSSSSVTTDTNSNNNKTTFNDGHNSAVVLRVPDPQGTLGRAMEALRRQKQRTLRRPIAFKAFTWQGKSGLSFVEAWGPQRVLSYRNARGFLYGEIDNEDGKVQCVYTGVKRNVKSATNATPRERKRRLRVASSVAYDNGRGINCEHVWPQSLLKKCGAKKAISDMHHLFPADVRANRLRGHLPFAEVDDHVAKLIGGGGGGGGEQRRREHRRREKELDPDDAYVSELAVGAWFEPAEVSKGNVARAIFYIRAIYAGYIEDNPENVSFFDKMKATLRVWHREDPPDIREIKRSHDIERIQGNCNPFVLKPEYVDLLFFANGD